MANDRGRSRLFLASGSVIVAAAAATCSYVFLWQRPSQGAEKAGTEPGISAEVERQTPGGGPCQEPFFGIESAFDTAGRRRVASATAAAATTGGMQELLLIENAPAVLATGVMVPGGADPHAAGLRKRIRCAIAAGLTRSGFQPEDAGGSRYFLRPRPVPDETAPKPVDLRHGEAKRDALNSIPFERFVHREAGTERHVLVLWLNEQMLSGEPLRKLSALKRFLHATASLLQKDGTFKIIGPFSPDLLNEMVAEARAYNYAPPYRKIFGQLSEKALWPDLADVPFYSYGPAADDRLLLGDQAAIYGTAQHFFAASGIHLQRTIATERTLARGLVRELRRRKIIGGPAGGDAVLISDLDSFSGRSVPHAIELALGHIRPGGSALHPGGRIYKLTYTQGLDGLLPAPETEAGGGSGRTSDQTQNDSLRRISAQLDQLDKDVRRERRRIAAIGVLGNSVHDKLLILHLLRRQFPQTSLFTTDYDQALGDGKERAATRNLIIASSFGPVLDKRIQRGIPPFQSTYETSAFLAALLAASDPAKGGVTPAAAAASLSEHLLASRIFEIDGNGNLLSYPGDRLPVLAASPPRDVREQKLCPDYFANCNAPRLVATAARIVEGRSSAQPAPLEPAVLDCNKNMDAANCGDIQPRAERLFPRFEKHSQYIMWLSLALGAATILILLHLGALPRRMRIEAWLGALILAAGAAACAFWEPLAQLLTEDGDGEPAVLTGGVSVWPAVLLRALGIGLATYFAFCVQRSLSKNLSSIAAGLRLDGTPARIHAAATLRNMFARIGNWRRSNAATAPAPQKSSAAWSSYVAGEAFWARCCRALTWSAVIYLSLAAGPFSGSPPVPARGPLAASAYAWTASLYTIAVFFLTCFVFDATNHCLRFVRKLRGPRWDWPGRTTRVFEDRLGLQGDAVRHWINLEFAAKRTRCIGPLSYYPLLLSAVLIAADGSAPAIAPPNLSFLVMAGAGLAALFVCAKLLSIEVNRVRAAAKQDLLAAFDEASRDPAERGFGQGIIVIGGPLDLRDGKRLTTLLRHLDLIGEDTYGSFARLPLVIAAMLLAGGAIWTIAGGSGIIPSMLD